MAAKIAILLAVAAVVMTGAGAHNITEILEGFPDYSLFNSYMTQTRVADEVNSRDTVTVLALPNGAMSALAAKKPLAGVKNALRLLVLLDYYDPAKLHGLPRGTALATTLYQTTGNAPGSSGFLNITDLRGGRVSFGPSAPGSRLTSDYTRSVKLLPYNLSVLEISAPVLFPGLLDAPSSSSSNISSLLANSGCGTFASLLRSSGVLKTLEAAEPKGLTLFAPDDAAFKAKGAPDLSSLSSADLVSLLQFHALPSYSPKASLRGSSRPIPTMASSAAGKFDLSVTSHGDDVTLHTGVGTSRIAETVLDSTPVCILAVDSILLPAELFAKAPAPAPGPASSTPSPSPAEAPSPMPLSPPAPPMASPEGSPAAAHAAEADKSPRKSAAVGLRPLGAVAAAVAVAAALL